MSPWRRALFGGALGALLVLILHPASRPYYLSILHFGDSPFLRSTSLLPETVRRLDDPTTAPDAAYVVLVAAEAEQRKEELKAADFTRLLKLVRYWRREDPDNAFWPQMESLYLLRLGREDEAEQAWIAAGKCVRWDDYQTVRISRLVDGLAAESGTEMGWHWAYAYERRSPAIRRLLLRHARGMRDRHEADTRQGLEVRLATLRNGVLIRDGAKSNATGLIGMEIVELSSYPPRFAIEVSQKKLILARQALANRFRAEGRLEDAARTERGFRDNDAWLALVRPDVIPERADEVAWLALMTGTLPGIALSIALLGTLIAGVGWLVERSPRAQVVFATPVAPVVGLVLAVLTYLGTELVFPSLWVVLCLTFFAFAPEHTRKIEPRDLGPFFRFTLVVLGLAWVGLIGLFLLGLTTAGVRLLPYLGVPPEYTGGSMRLLGMSGIVFGLVLLTAPAWGIVQRFAPPRLAGLAMREFGIGIAVFGLILAILAGPAAVLLDDDVREEMSQLAQNEPLYSQNASFGP